MNSAAIMVAARVPLSVQPQLFDPWCIQRTGPTTLLRHSTSANASASPLRWDVIMLDSPDELRTHLPIFTRAAGRVLVTGLGLGCVVRGLLAKPKVEHIDVVEIDGGILGVIGPEFAANPRVTLHHGDALTIRLPGTWDFAWHDLWTEGSGLQSLHAELLVKFAHACGWQGAWQFPENLAAQLPWNHKRERRRRSIQPAGQAAA
jgi:hypothetical protein